jgi:hypothetical protein
LNNPEHDLSQTCSRPAVCLSLYLLTPGRNRRVIFVRATVHENNERWCSGSDIRYGIAACAH